MFVSKAKSCTGDLKPSCFWPLSRTPGHHDKIFSLARWDRSWSLNCRQNREHSRLRASFPTPPFALTNVLRSEQIQTDSQLISEIRHHFSTSGNSHSPHSSKQVGRRTLLKNSAVAALPIWEEENVEWHVRQTPTGKWLQSDLVLPS